MDDFFFALLLVALATPLIAFAALVVAIRQARAIRRLETRLRGLEFLRAQEPPTRAVAAPAPRPPAAAAPPAAPLIATPEPTPAPAIENSRRHSTAIDRTAAPVTVIGTAGASDRHSATRVATRGRL